MTIPHMSDEEIFQSFKSLHGALSRTLVRLQEVESQLSDLRWRYASNTAERNLAKKLDKKINVHG